MNPEDRQALLEQENRERTERLAAKVSALKNFTMDIEYEARDQRLLDEMSGGFESTFSFLSTAGNRINRVILSGRGHRKFVYLTAIVMAFLLYFLYRHYK